MKNLNDITEQEVMQERANTVPDEARMSASELMAKFGGKSEKDLTDTLADVISRQKRAGVFDAAQAELTAQNIMPMLNAEQAKKLNAILEMFKESPNKTNI